MALTINKAIIVGNAGGAPRVRTLQDREGADYKVAELRIATRTGYGDNETTEWHSVVAFRRNAEAAERFIDAGTLVGVEGSLRTRKYTDRNGAERTATEIVADALHIGPRPQPVTLKETKAETAPVPEDIGDLPF